MPKLGLFTPEISEQNNFSLYRVFLCSLFGGISTDGPENPCLCRFIYIALRYKIVTNKMSRCQEFLTTACVAKALPVHKVPVWQSAKKYASQMLYLVLYSSKLVQPAHVPLAYSLPNIFHHAW